MRTAIAVVASAAVFYAAPTLWALGFGARAASPGMFLILAVGVVSLGIAVGARFALGALTVSLFSTACARLFARVVVDAQFRYNITAPSIALVSVVGIALWIVVRNRRDVGLLAIGYAIGQAVTLAQIAARVAGSSAVFDWTSALTFRAVTFVYIGLLFARGDRARGVTDASQPSAVPPAPNTEVLETAAVMKPTNVEAMAASTSVTADAHVCPHCDASNTSTAKFCVSCGQALGGAITPRFCTGCGTALRPGLKFCDVCGTAVGPAAST